MAPLPRKSCIQIPLVCGGIANDYNLIFPHNSQLLARGAFHSNLYADFNFSKRMFSNFSSLLQKKTL